MTWRPLLVCILLAVPPLTDGQRGRVDTARDGRDHREEAFVALVEAMGAAPRDVPADASAPDLAALLAAPDEHRGAVRRLDGVLQQRHRLARPFDAADEWYVRDDAGRAFIIYVVAPEDALADVAAGMRVRGWGRFYKRVDARARDGATRAYAAFVGPAPFVVPPPGSAGPGAPPIAFFLVLSAMAILTVWLVRRATRRTTPARRLRRSDPEAEPLDDPASLPDDPVDALGELRTRAASPSPDATNAHD